MCYMSSSDDVIFPLGNPRVFYLAPHNIVYLEPGVYRRSVWVIDDDYNPYYDGSFWRLISMRMKYITAGDEEKFGASAYRSTIYWY